MLSPNPLSKFLSNLKGFVSDVKAKAAPITALELARSLRFG
ncbi:MAG: hypothetical protein AAFS13_03985 [Pseudomonadota bacterium]